MGLDGRLRSAAVLGVTIADAAETTLRSPLLVAGMLAGVGVLLISPNRTSRGAHGKRYAPVGWRSGRGSRRRSR